MDTTAARFVEPLRRFVRRRVASADDTDDVVQEVLTRLWQHRERVDDDAVPAWLFTVARSVLTDRYRRDGRQPGTVPLDESALAEPMDTGAEVRLGGLEDCLLPLLEAMPDGDRELLRRTDLLGERQSDLARELDMSPSGLKSRVQRARKRLLAQLERCCRLELDHQGLPVDWECRSDGCGCSDDDAAD